ncbi:sensor histidine kinase [Clostridium sp. Marseille-P2415]|uniref:sensor histidine kinase n=1 Tax=Clostridium sp. Marseille-P2415 TaxID=1805471 RepID=UPI0009885495|nr:ATP-binding protein [Clostridium sp. Marseille-P2415]
MEKHRKMSKKELLRNIIITLTCLLLATIGSYMMLFLGGYTNNVGIVYMMAVVLISRYSNGYVPGVIASFISVICVNFVFTYPYMAFNFTMEGYPITFIALLIISSITSATTTHLKEQSRILNEREKLLMEAEKETMRANLLRAISHDLRTPLTGIIGASSAYLENSGCMPDTEKTNLVSNIREDANWLLNMVENLLSVTRIRDTGAQVTKQLEPLEEVASEAIDRFHKRLPQSIVHVTVPDELVMVPMDATLIEQVIINLLENAVYHSNSTEPISLSIYVRGGYAWFEVRDQGVGISPERLVTLFDGYTSSPNSSGDSHKGMGIGLSICKTIVAAHDGSITAANEEHGAVFTFTLPLGEDTYE